ncbi:MAG: Slp family lipoprotein [Proteobacteria bacterium]|nr:Slp family lipoprotein [Pseudomonadota bacterium]
MKGWLFLTSLAAGLTISCAPISKEVLHRVDKTLTFRDIQKDPGAYAGKTVLWGGVIIETSNRQQETLIKVRQTELDFQQKPTNLDRSLGRFLIRQAGFLDPAIYKEGREITVAGEVTGKEVLPLGNSQYAYPVLWAKEIHLWERRSEYRPIYPPWYYDPYYFRWHHHPYWRHPYGW